MTAEIFWSRDNRENREIKKWIEFGSFYMQRKEIHQAMPQDEWEQLGISTWSVSTNIYPNTRIAEWC